MQNNGPTRRAFVGTGLAVGGTLLAGCVSGTDGDESNGSDADPYAVEMEPMGDVEFEHPPERWLALLPSYADMGFALGAGQTLGIQLPERYATEYYDELPGVEFDADEVVRLNNDGVDKELFYELDADVHFMEPNQLIHWYNWSETDVEDIESSLGPFFGNFIRRRSDEWHDYRYYTLYEAFDKMADVFRERERYDAFVEVHDELLETVDSRLPPREDRPSVLLVYPADEPPEAFYPYRLDDGGVSTKQWRDLGAVDVFGGSDVGHYAGDGATVDLETLVELDPEAMLVRGQEGVSDAEFQDRIVEPLQDDSVASEVTAVQEGAIYNGGYLDQGPIINLFQTERGAQDLYPEQFGDENLFDRQRVADIVLGDF
ncbi:ABC transporter substrate-binding protein [Natronorubrum sp. FCH18a]|uniref:ABC transporter substrate-binding protein n=1 Tax=Natronorubrum sp. FCH18a TaxID=3447018 RepID=UPI003F5146B3